MKYPAHVQTASCAVLIDKCFVPTVTYSSELLSSGPENGSNLLSTLLAIFSALWKLLRKELLHCFQWLLPSPKLLLPHMASSLTCTALSVPNEASWCFIPASFIRTSAWNWRLQIKVAMCSRIVLINHQDKCF